MVRDTFPQLREDLNPQGILGFECGRNRTDTYQINPDFKYSVGNGGELRPGGVYTLGNGPSADFGSVSTGELRWQVFNQKASVQLLWCAARRRSFFGSDGEDTTIEFTGIVDPMTGGDPGNSGLHLNADWLARPEPGSAEHHHGYRIGGAISHVLNGATPLVAAHAQGRGERDLRIVEVGFQRRLSGDVSFALVVGRAYPAICRGCGCVPG